MKKSLGITSVALLALVNTAFTVGRVCSLRANGGDSAALHGVARPVPCRQA